MSRTRDFNLLKVADVSANSTNTNSVSVVVNADTSGNSQNNSSNENVNFPQQGLSTPMPTYREAAAPMSYPTQTLFPTGLTAPAELRSTVINTEEVASPSQ